MGQKTMKTFGEIRRRKDLESIKENRSDMMIFLHPKKKWSNIVNLKEKK